MIRTKQILIPAILAIASTGFAQKDKPKLHSDFYVGTYPAYRDTPALLNQENARLLLVGFHQNWDIEKIAKESRVAEPELDRLFADLEEARLATEVDLSEYHPRLPVIRDRDISRIDLDLEIHTRQYADLLRSNWPEIEAALAPLTGTNDIPSAQLMYQVVAGAIVFGGMNDALYDDQTIMISPPRRVGSQRYYAWMVESDPVRAGILKRDEWESDGYTLISIGKGLAENRTNLERIRMEHGMVLENAEARQFRSFVAIFTKERLLPYFKTHRAEFLNVLNELDAGKYVSVSSAFAWYYDQMANGVVENLVKDGRIQPPDGHYAFALKVPVTR